MVSYEVQQSSTTRPLLFYMVLSSDHITGATGLSPTVLIAKTSGTVMGAFATPTGAVTEVGNGWYQIAANATDNATLGLVSLHATAATADPTDTLFAVVNYSPHASIPTAAANAANGLMTVGTGSGQVNPSSGNVGLIPNAIDWTNFTSNVRLGLGTASAVSVIITSPVSAATDYAEYGHYATSGVRYYFSPTTNLYLWTDGSNWFLTSTAPGVTLPAAYFKSSTAVVTSSFAAQGTASGSPLFTFHANSTMGGFQPEYDPLSYLTTNVGSLGGNATALAPSATALSNATWTTARAGKIDNLDATVSSRSAPATAQTITVPATMATLANQTTIINAVNSITNNSKIINISGPSQMAIPATGTTQYEFDITIIDPATGALVNADSTPTVTARQVDGTDLSGNLSAVSNVSAGRYKFTYGVISTAVSQEAIMPVAATVNALSAGATIVAVIAPNFSVSFTSSDRTTLNTMATNVSTTEGVVEGVATLLEGGTGTAATYAIAAAVKAQTDQFGFYKGAVNANTTYFASTATVSTASTGVRLPFQILGFGTNTGEANTDGAGNIFTVDTTAAASAYTAITAIGTALVALAAKFTGITSLANWLRAMFRSDAPDATALSEINVGLTVITAISRVSGSQYTVSFSSAVTWDNSTAADTNVEMFSVGDNLWEPVQILSQTNATTLAIQGNAQAQDYNQIRVTGQPAHLTAATGFALGTTAIPTSGGMVVSGTYAPATESLQAIGSNEGGGGTGPFVITVNVKDSISSANIAGATVRASGGQSAQATTNGIGNAVLSLGTGAVTLTISAPGYAGFAGSISVNADATVNEVLVALVIPTPPSPSQITGYLYSKDANGSIVTGIGFNFQMTIFPVGETGTSYSKNTQTVVSDGTGLVSLPMERGATYLGSIQAVPEIKMKILVPTVEQNPGSSFPLPTLLGLYTNG